MHIETSLASFSKDTEIKIYSGPELHISNMQSTIPEQVNGEDAFASNT